MARSRSRSNAPRLHERRSLRRAGPTRCARAARGAGRWCRGKATAKERRLEPPRREPLSAMTCPFGILRRLGHHPAPRQRRRPSHSPGTRRCFPYAWLWFELGRPHRRTLERPDPGLISVAPQHHLGRPLASPKAEEPRRSSSDLDAGQGDHHPSPPARLQAGRRRAPASIPTARVLGL